MEVDAVVVLLAHVRGVEALFLQGIGAHDARRDSLLHFGVEFGRAADADLFLAVFRAPYRQGSAPETASAEVPVLDILKPLAETPGAGVLRFPADFLVQGDHAVLDRGGLDEP